MRAAVRGHWGIENRNHYVRDCSLGEDASRIRHKPGIFARLRSFALNILRANGVSNVSEALYTNALSLDRLLAYGLPKQNRKLAEDLEKARAEAEKNGTPMMMRMPFERTYDKRDRKFYAMPQPALPDKPNRKGEEPAFYQRPGEEA